MKNKSDINNRAWIIVFALIALFVLVIIVLINAAKPVDNSSEIEATPTATTTVKPTATPAAKVSHEPEEINGIIWLENKDWSTHYSNYFADARDTEDIYTVRGFKADINSDGMAEVYSWSRETINRSTSYVIECYDLNTETYSKLLSPKNLDFFPMEVEDAVYFLVYYDDFVTKEETRSYYHPYLADGQLRIEEVDNATLSQINKYIAKTSLEMNYGNDILFIVKIKVYDISKDEVMIREYSDEIEGITDEIIMYFGSVKSDYNEEIEHKYKAVVNIIYEDQNSDTTFYFGDSEYLTTYHNNYTINSINEELHTFLMSLADGSYEDDN